MEKRKQISGMELNVILVKQTVKRKGLCQVTLNVLNKATKAIYRDKNISEICIHVCYVYIVNVWRYKTDF